MAEQIELGYRTAADLVDDEYDSIMTDDEINGGRVVVLPGARVVYLCTDAMAWGTLTTCDRNDEAVAVAARIMQTLRDAISD